MARLARCSRHQCHHLLAALVVALAANHQMKDNAVPCCQTTWRACRRPFGLPSAAPVRLRPVELVRRQQRGVAAPEGRRCPLRTLLQQPQRRSTRTWSCVSEATSLWWAYEGLIR